MTPTEALAIAATIGNVLRALKLCCDESSDIPDIPARERITCCHSDCEHVQELKRLSEQAKHEGAVSGIIDDNPYKALPFFTPSPAPIPPTAHHNVFPPITSEGIQEAAKRLRELRAQWDKEDAENLAGVPMHEPLPPRVPDAYESAHGPACGRDDSQDEVKP